MTSFEDLLKELDGDQPSKSKKKVKKDIARSQTSPKDLTILQAFERIVEMAENSGLDINFFNKALPYLEPIAGRLSLTPIQTALLTLFIDRSEQGQIMPSEIANYTGCRTTRILQFLDVMEELEALHYLRASRSRGRLSYRVPQEVLKALRANEPYVYHEDPVVDTQSFFDRFDQYMDEKDNDEISYEMLTTLVKEKLNDIKRTPFAKELKRARLTDETLMIFIYMAHLFVENSDDMIGFHDLSKLYDDGKVPVWTRQPLRTQRSKLFKINFIENVNNDGMLDPDTFKLTDYAKEHVLGELNLASVGKSCRDLIKSDTLTEKTLVYNPTEGAEITELASILSAKRFEQVQQRLRKAGMRQGFCCLFYGAPGTGKTETVYQLARQTGREILRVDVEKIKSCWVGDSEKNIKTLFTRYRNICRDMALAPILLFNEADAVLGLRMEGASKAVDKMENSIQNIILQEMESLEGIMIATTNLTTNLDKAFERRFLYKVRFERPTIEARSRIWQGMLPGLTESDARYLSSKFDLTGGEIENIVRRHTVGAILSGKETIDVTELADMCKHERLNNNSMSRIGF